MKDFLMGGAVCLRRNYADLPFSPDSRADVAQAVNERMLPVLEKEEDTFTYLMVQQMEPEQRRVLIAHGLLDPDSADNALSSAYLRQDDCLCVQTAAADHLRIAAYDEDGSLSDCLALCLPLEQALAVDHPYARSAQYGHLTARPCDAGSGLRASLLLHLPMLTLLKQIPNMTRLCGMAGLLLRSAAPAQEERGDALYLLENRMTLGIEAADIVRRLQSHAERLTALERQLRAKAAERADDFVLDAIYRAYGVARYARRISRAEGMHLWSALTLGQALGTLNMQQAQLEKLYLMCAGTQSALEAAAKQQSAAPDVLRARRIRDLIHGGN